MSSACQMFLSFLPGELFRSSITVFQFVDSSTAIWYLMSSRESIKRNFQKIPFLYRACDFKNESLEHVLIITNILLVSLG